VNATVELKPTAGSKYSGVIDEYHEVKAFLQASRPYNIRMIGQVPVIGKTVFDMASDGQNFEVSIPSKNKFLVGPVSLDRSSSKPIENLRPQHLLDALLWPEIRKEEAVLFEEFNDEAARYYVLTVLRGGLTARTFTSRASRLMAPRVFSSPMCASRTGKELRQATCNRAARLSASIRGRFAWTAPTMSIAWI
jgi:hypothetical protein